MMISTTLQATAGGVCFASVEVSQGTTAHPKTLTDDSHGVASTVDGREQKQFDYVKKISVQERAVIVMSTLTESISDVHDC